MASSSPVYAVHTTPGAGGAGAPAVFRARRIVLATGPWTADLLRGSFGFALPLDVWEVSYAYCRVRRGSPAAQRAAATLPVWRAFGGSCRCYGFPTHERADAVKVAPHGHHEPEGRGVLAAPRERSGRPTRAYARASVAFAQQLFGSDMLEQGEFEEAAAELEPTTCLYTVTRDGRFVIDWLPASAHAAPRSVLVLGGFSGSGFKHGAAVGRIAQELVSGAGRPPTFPEATAVFSITRPGLFGETGGRLAEEHVRAGGGGGSRL